jgi:hypothetical protein
MDNVPYETRCDFSDIAYNPASLFSKFGVFVQALYMLDEVFKGDPVKMKEDLHETLNLFQKYDLIETKT